MPQPLQADPSPPSQAASPPAHSVPGAAPPAYPGWESTAEQRPDDRDVPPGASRPSRYDPPTPEASAAVPAQATEPVTGWFPPDRAPGDPYGAPGRGGPYESSGAPAQAGPYGAPAPGGPYGAHPSGVPAGAPTGAHPYGGGQAPPVPAGPAYPGPAGYPAPPPGDRSQHGQGGRLGTAALVLGIVSLVLLFACGAGVLTAIAGVVLGIVAVVKDSNRGRAWVGLLLSALALIIAAVFLAWFVNKVGGCLDLPRELQQRCVEERFGIDIQPPG
ncbi:DUF4190 domain-containing protein [Planomonospora venezuelensis]|uniref:DUF4190 domain-containing protein n=1 Tax=Planomonospora venezuelensis TaxID=1999 RepID=A0A841DFD8_PLAVE|nr:DUF4190 domain-containing protein [Planomonospora venezuelensis]MBB5967453.1 hypothetical protein [Planomonospora venezuelensis]